MSRTPPARFGVGRVAGHADVRQVTMLDPRPASSTLRVGSVSTFPPTQCGLATFATATRASLHQVRPSWQLPVIEVLPTPAHAPGADVDVQWIHGDARSLQQAVTAANRCGALLVQHEFGIFGGIDGAEIIDLIDRVTCPVVAVLHTVLRDATMGQRRVLTALARRCSALVVMSDAARNLLLQTSAVPASKVVVIPHGAHPAVGREPLGSAGPPHILTWGLVGPGKGLERAITAVATMVERDIDVRYSIVGETHPNVRARDGERYRQTLIALADRLGVSGHVRFDDIYRPVDELVRIVADADVVLIPYDSRVQVTSGVLVEALAAGRPVVATAFPHAQEVLIGGAGIVVAHDDPEGLVAALTSLVTDPDRARQMSRYAYRDGRAMLWSAVGESTATLLEGVVRSAAAPRRGDLFLDHAAALSREDAS